MRCINRRIQFLQLYRLISCAMGFTLAMPAGAADNTFFQSRQKYKEQLHNYSGEVKGIGNSSPAALSSPIKIITGSLEARQMPPLPSKSVQYNQLIGNGTLDDIKIFQDNSLVVKKPKLSALISVQQNLNPFSMDAKFSQGVELKDLLLFGLTNNLDIHIARNNAKAAKYMYLSSLGQFLPDISMGDNQLWTKGKLGLPLNNGSDIRLNGPFMIANAGFTHHVYRGGKILFAALQSKHQLNASNSKFHAGYSDTLSEIARLYYELVLQETNLQIRIRAVDTSEEQVRVATKRFEEGSGTNLDVLQGRTQLSSDRQNLLEQQVIRRQAAIDLAAILNYDMAFDLQPGGTISRTLLVQQSANIDELLKLALANRAELKQLNELRKAAKAQIGIATAPLQPTVDFGGSVYGLGRDPGSVDALYLLSLNMQWRLGGLGTVDTANIATARVQARNAAVELQKKVIDVSQGVRTAFIRSHAADQNVVESDTRVASAVEELRLAEIRYKTGVGTHLDVLTAQRDYTQAQIAKAQAITTFNVAQVQLVRELGLVTVENLAARKPIL